MIIHGKLKKQYRQALEYYASVLFTPQMKKHIEVRVSFRKLTNDYHGHVFVDDYNVLGMPRSFIIEVNKNDTNEEILKTLAHEMIHVKQYARSELNEEMSVWRGRKVNSDAIPYDEQPWEQEAKQREQELCDSFLASQT
jgi:hypothetical protein